MTNIQEISDFAERIKDSHLPYSRLLGQQIKSMLKDNCGIKEIEVIHDVFEDVIKTVGLTPVSGSVFRFVRIEDLNGNSVDIQTRK